MSLLLKPLELCYRGINRARRNLYRRRAFPVARLPRAVISIGNLAIGGGGKTPTTISLARALSERGFRVVVLTRGYKRRGTAQTEEVLSSDWRRYGDEPVLLHRALPEVPVVVGADRYQSGLWYLQNGDCDVFLLDDGFQHLRLHRDCDVVLVNRRSRYLREGRSALRDADIILSRNAAEDLADDDRLFDVELRPAHLTTESGQREEIATLSGQRLFAFAALADNEQFFAALQSLGADLAGTRGFRDHHAYTAENLESLLAGAASVRGRLITTEKDAVKLDLNVLTLAVEMKIGRSAEVIDRLSRIVEKTR